MVCLIDHFVVVIGRSQGRKLEEKLKQATWLGTFHQRGILICILYIWGEEGVSRKEKNLWRETEEARENDRSTQLWPPVQRRNW
ncbi:hypothetical protein LEMLEM_LOCUS22821 [Lemmus lemmus]